MFEGSFVHAINSYSNRVQKVEKYKLKSLLDYEVTPNDNTLCNYLKALLHSLYGEI